MKRWHSSRSSILVAGIALVLFTSSANADWVDAYIRPEVGIDQIERFLVIRAPDTTTLFGLTMLPACDVNDDNIQDFFVCRKIYQDTPLRCFLYLGGNPPDGTNDGEYQNLWSTHPGNLGDVNGDSYCDFGVLTAYPASNFELYYGGPLLDDTPDWSTGDFPYVSTAADLDADDIPEIPLSTDINGGFVNIYEAGVDVPDYIIPDTSTDFGRSHNIGEINGDDWPDLLVGAYLNRDTNLVKVYFGGPSFDTIADFTFKSVSPQFGKIILPCGDFNADGYDDVYIGGGANDLYGVYFGGPSLDNVLDIPLNWPGHFPADDAVVGDFNNDGHPDIVLGYDFGDEIYLHLGGPTTDSLTDLYIENGMVPGGNLHFGLHLVSPGDFNGDGIDDFGVYSRTNNVGNWVGEVNMFAGWDTTLTDIGDDEDAVIPVSIRLHQNYPNPFNPSTTIEFALSQASHARVTVHNILGQQVALLIDKQMQVGAHRVIWNGRFDTGATAPSGVYLYTLETDEYTLSRKMLLLK